MSLIGAIQKYKDEIINGNLTVTGDANDRVLSFGATGEAGAKRMDVSMYGATSAAHLKLDASANTLTLTGITASGFGATSYTDDAALSFGAGTDVSIEWDTASTPDCLQMSCAADDTLWEIGISAATQLSFDLKWFANEASGASYLYCDASANLIYTTGIDFQFKDDDFLVFGNGAGAAGDVQLEWDTTGTDALRMTATADGTLWEIGNGTADFDVVWYGGSGNYVTFDESISAVVTTDIDFKFLDNDHILIGTATGAGTADGDVDISWDATNLIVAAAADDTLIEIGDSAATQLSFDLKIYGNTANGADFLYFDASKNYLYTTGIDVKFIDNDHLLIGTATGAGTADGDVDVYWDATNLIVAAAADDSVIEIGDAAATQKSFDLKWYGNEANGASYVTFDASINTIVTTDIEVKFLDNDKLYIGTATNATTADGDVAIWWDGTDLEIHPKIDDTVIQLGENAATQLSFDVKLYGDAASGADYILWDASRSELSFAGNAHLNPAGACVFFDDFLQDTLSTDYWTSDLDGGTCAITEASGGTAVLTTVAGDNNHVEMATAEFSSTSQVKVVEVRLKIDDITTACINAGLCDVKTAGATNIAIGIGAGDAIAIDAGVADFAGFAFDTDADTDGWFGGIVYGAGSSELEGAGATAPANGVFQTLRMEMDSTRKVSFFIDGVAYGSKTTAALDATTTMALYLAVCNRAGGITRALTVDYVYAMNARA